MDPKGNGKEGHFRLLQINNNKSTRAVSIKYIKNSVLQEKQVV